MTKAWVPPRVEYELAQETQRRQAEALKVLAVERAEKWRQDFNRDLEDIEHGLTLVYCPDPAPLDAVACGARPGRWHIYRPATSGPMLVYPLIGADGEFREPGSWVFELLKSQDWWNDRVLSERSKRERRLEAARKRREEDERAEFVAEVAEKWKAVSRTQVSMSRDTAWGQNARGAGIARAEKKRREG